MRVLLIDVNCNNGSTGKIVYDLYSNINSRGNTAAICYGRGPKIKEKNIYKFGIDIETYLHALLARITGYNGCFSYFSTKRLIKYIDCFKPDIIHIHELHAYFVNVKTLIKYIKLKKIPVVWTFHCEYMYTGKCGYAYDCEKWKTDCYNCPLLNDYPRSLFFDRTRKMFNAKKQMLSNFNFTIVTPSKWLADRVKQSFLKNKNISIIHNGIDTLNMFYPRNKDETAYLYDKYGIDINKKIVLSVAPNIMDDRKGGKDILEIAKDMRDYQFVLVGTDKSIKYSNNVIFIKRTNNQDELARLYSISDLFLICSKKENFPTTCLEAFSCGLPVVGFDEGGTKETVTEPYGEFIKSGNKKLLKETIENQLSKKFIKKILAEKAIEKYSKENMCNQYSELYSKLLIYS